MSEKRYLFKIELSGYGETPDAAWRDAVDHLYEDPKQMNEMPEEYEVEENEQG